MPNLTSDQLRKLQADLKARGISGVLFGNPNAEAKLLSIYNADTALLAWKTRLTITETVGALSWDELDPESISALTLILLPGYLDLAATGIRTGLAVILNRAPASLSAVMTEASRPVSVFEQLYVDTKEQPAVLSVEGPMVIQDVKDALGVTEGSGDRSSAVLGISEAASNPEGSARSQPTAPGP